MMKPRKKQQDPSFDGNRNRKLEEGGEVKNDIGDVPGGEGQLVELLLSNYEKSSRPVFDVSHRK